MATYDYTCINCGHNWEVEAKITDETLKECPKCLTMGAKRLISHGAAFILSGGGWAREGYSGSK